MSDPTRPAARKDAGSLEDLSREVERLRAERGDLRAQLDDKQKKRARRRRWRDGSVVALVIVSILLIVVGSTALWARQTLLDTDRFVATVAPLAGDADVADALGSRLSEQIVVELNLQQVIEDALPPEGAVVAPALTGAVTDFVDQAIVRVFESDQFATLWTGAVRVAHTEVLVALRGGSEVLVTEGGTVYLNLLPVVNQALGQIEQQIPEVFGRTIDIPEITPDTVPDEARARIEEALGVDLNEEFGVVPVFESSRLAAAQDALRIFDRLTFLLIVLAPIAAVAALWLSRHRRRTLMQLTIGSMVGFVIMRRLVLRVEADVVAQTPRPENADAVQSVLDILLRGFYNLTLALLVLGAVVLLLAWVTGPYPWARSLRAGTTDVVRKIGVGPGVEESPVTRWVREHTAALQIAGAMLWVVVVLWASIGWVGFLVSLLLLAVYEVAVWRLSMSSPPPPAGEAEELARTEREPAETEPLRRKPDGAVAARRGRPPGSSS